jgi:hypothetical protein
MIAMTVFPAMVLGANMITTIISVLAVCIALLGVIIALRPSDFRITRTALMNAPAAAAFAQVNDFHNWNGWSPWAKLDPQAHYTYEGALSGVGAITSWDGNNKVGAGRSTITASRPNDQIVIRLEFFRPFKATNIAEFDFRPEGAKTLVTWSMYGNNGFMGKAVSLIFNCEKMVGKQFEEGLAAIRSIVENGGKA